MPVFRSSSLFNTGSVTVGSLVLALPLGTAPGDLLIAYLSGSGPMVTGGVTPPGGWSVMYPPTTGTFGDNNYAAYFKVAGSAEPATYTWTLGTASVVTVFVICVTGTSGAIRGNRVDLAVATGASFTSTVLAGVQSADLTLVLGLFGDDAGANSTETPPATPPWTTIGNIVAFFASGPSCHGSVCSWAPGSQPGATFVSTSSTAVWAVITVAVEALAAPVYPRPSNRVITAPFFAGSRS
jgi:hypothetical protein